MDELQGRVAVVTGAASGIGFAISAAFADEGLDVVLADIDPSALAEAVDRLAGARGNAHGVEVDVSDPVSVAALGDAVIERFGTLHIAVNNAGIVNGGMSWELPVADWDRLLSVNLWGVIHGVRTFVPLILASGEPGHVINVASLAAVNPMAGIGPYVVAKHGVLGLSDVLRLELAQVGAPIGVSVVMPGSTATQMNPIGTHPATRVATNVVDAIRRNRAYVFTDHDGSRSVAERLREIVGARDDVVTG